MSDLGRAYYVEKAEKSELAMYPTIFSGMLIPLLVDGERLSITRTNQATLELAEIRYANILHSLHGFVLSASVIDLAQVAKRDWKGHRGRHVKSLFSQMLKFSNMGSVGYAATEIVYPNELPGQITSKITRQIEGRPADTDDILRNDVYMLTSFCVTVSSKKPKIGALVSVAFASAVDGVDVSYFGMSCTNPDISELLEGGLIDQNRFNLGN